MEIVVGQEKLWGSPRFKGDHGETLTPKEPMETPLGSRGPMKAKGNSKAPLEPG